MENCIRGSDVFYFFIIILRVVLSIIFVSSESRMYCLVFVFVFFLVFWGVFLRFLFLSVFMMVVVFFISYFV